MITKFKLFENKENVYKISEILDFTHPDNNFDVNEIRGKLEKIFLNKYIEWSDDTYTSGKIRGKLEKMIVTSVSKSILIYFYVNKNSYYMSPYTEIKVIEPKVVISPLDPYGEEDWGE